MVLGEKDASRRIDRLSDWCCGPSGMMVLFLKHVHLQNFCAADGKQSELVLSMRRTARRAIHLQEAEARAMNAARRSTRR